MVNAAVVKKTQSKKKIAFSSGKLGFMTEASKAASSICVAFVAKDGQAHREGLRIGDLITSVNGKALLGNDNDAFIRIVRTLQDRNVRVVLEATTTISDDDALNINEKSVLLEAGTAYKREVQLAKGESIRVYFWVTEIGKDIGFSLEEQGHKNLVMPHTKVWNKSNPAGPASFTAERDGKFTLCWDNAHSWLRSKHLNYFVEVLPKDDTPDAFERMTGESQHLKGVLKSMEDKIASMEKDLAAEKADKAEVQKNLGSLAKKLQDAKSGAGAKAKSKTISKKAPNNENRAQNSGPKTDLAV